MAFVKIMVLKVWCTRNREPLLTYLNLNLSPILKSTVSHLSFFALLLISIGYAQGSNTILRKDFTKHFSDYGVQGCFALYDQKADTLYLSDLQEYEVRHTPASSFKIFNSLVGLETGVIADEHVVFPWDSVVRQNASWNADQDLETAFKNSTVWYYQEMARRIGAQKMKDFLVKTGYGNTSIDGGIDKFWLTGGLQISPKEQMVFLIKLHKNDLPFSKRTINIVKHIMIAQDTLDYVLRAKTGWGYQDNTDKGWYVGYVEKGKKNYFFVNCIQSNQKNMPDFGPARKEIALRILREMEILP